MRRRRTRDRLEAHLGRGEGLLELIRQEFELNRAEHELNRAEFRETRSAVNGVRAAIREMAAASRENTEAIRDLQRTVEKGFGDLRGDIRGNGLALMHVFDELRRDRGEPGGAAA